MGRSWSVLAGERGQRRADRGRLAGVGEPEAQRLGRDPVIDGALVRGDKDKLSGLRDTLDLLEREGVPVMVLAQVPLFETDVAQRYIYGRLFGLPAPTHYPPNTWGPQANEALRALVAEFPHAVFVDPAASLCRRADGHCDVQIDDRFGYADDQHLSMGGAQALARRLVQSRANFLDPRDASRSVP